MLGDCAGEGMGSAAALLERGEHLVRVSAQCPLNRVGRIAAVSSFCFPEVACDEQQNGGNVLEATVSFVPDVLGSIVDLGILEGCCRSGGCPKLFFSWI